MSRQRLENAIRMPGHLWNHEVLAGGRHGADGEGAVPENAQRLREAEARGLPIHVVRSNTQAQFQAFIETLRTKTTDDRW